MRLFVAISALLAATACASQGAAPTSEADSNDCAVVVAVAKEHYKFGPDNPALPLKAGADGWKPSCDWAKYGLAFTDYKDDPSLEPRQRLRYVDFQKPVFDGAGAAINTSIMHGPLAGTGTSCQMRSGIAGWTVERCKMVWIS